MKINGKVHCFFEQSGTFKNEKAEGENFHYYWIDKKDLKQ